MQHFRWVSLTSLALVLLTLAAFRDVPSLGFVNWDDQEYVTANPGVQRGLSLAGLRWSFTTFACANWHPLTWLSLQLDYSLHGLDPAGYHVTNLLLHMGSVVALFVALWQMTGALGRSACVAALFAVHPLHVESVAWVSERKDVLSTFFGMLALCAYGRYSARHTWGTYLALLLALACSLLAKPMLVTLPCVLLLLDYWPLARFPFAPPREQAPAPGASTGALVVEKLPLAALALAACIVTLQAQGQAGAVMSLEDIPFRQRAMNAVVTPVAYLGRTVWPAHLSPYYPHPGEGLSLARTLAACTLLAAITAGAFLLRRRCPYVVVGWLWYLGTLVPVLGLVQVGGQAGADRYTYVPLIGIFLLVAWGVPDLLGRLARPALLVPAAGVLLLALTELTARQVRVWSTSETLWSHAARVEAPNYMAQLMLGNHYLDQGRVAEAEAHFRNAIAIEPRWSIAHFALAGVLDRAGRPAEAEEHYRIVAEQHPERPAPWLHLATVCRAQGKLDDAARYYEEVLRLLPSAADARLGLGIVETMRGRLERAEEQLVQALRLRPRDPESNFHLGMLCALTGRQRDAVQLFQRAVTLHPGAAPYQGALALALLDLGDATTSRQVYAELLRQFPSWPAEAAAAARGLATHPNPGHRNGRLAVHVARQACHAHEQPPAACLDTLAAAWAEAGQFEEAVATARKALEAATASGQEPLAGQIRQRLRLYEQRQPFHEPAPPAPPGS